MTDQSAGVHKQFRSPAESQEGPNRQELCLSIVQVNTVHLRVRATRGFDTPAKLGMNWR